MVTTVAPTMPVEAAKKAPTTTTDTARPPGSGPKNPRHGCQKIIGNFRALQRDAHQNKHQNR
jgi:hypothetical protein